MVRPRHRAAVLALALAASACAPVAPRPEDAARQVWPEAPDPPRVEFVKTFSRAEDFGIQRGFFRRLVDLLLGENELRLERPMAVVAVNGVVYVADPGSKVVHRFDPVAGRHDAIGAAEGDTALLSPVGLARGAAGEVYVTDSAAGRVLVIRPGAAAAAPTPLPLLQRPTGVAFDAATGRLYVVETGAHRVSVFERDGKLHARYGSHGSDDGEFNYPTQLWRDARGRLYVTDSLNFRIQILDAQGRFLRKFGQAGDAMGDFMRQKGLATDSFGHVYIVDALLSALQVFNEAGDLLLSLGELGQGRGEFWLPAGIFIGDGDTIYVADSYNKRIQVFRYIGGPT